VVREMTDDEGRRNWEEPIRILLGFGSDYGRLTMVVRAPRLAALGPTNPDRSPNSNSPDKRRQIFQMRDRAAGYLTRPRGRELLQDLAGGFAPVAKANG
jgi:hypothetical protein